MSEPKKLCASCAVRGVAACNNCCASAWSKEPPKSAGAYWHRFDRNDEPELMQVKRLADGELAACRYSYGPQYVARVGGEWQRIKEPKP